MNINILKYLLIFLSLLVLISCGDDSQNELDSRFSLTPLDRAAKEGNISQLKILLANGADINAAEGLGNLTALHWAASQGKTDTIKFLLSNNADIHGRDKYGNTALHKAARAVHSSIETVKLLLAMGADIHAINKRGRMALHDAAASGRVKRSKLLLIKGADINAKDENNSTPLHGASADGKTSVVQLLLANGARVNEKDKHGSTSLLRATYSKHIETIKLLLANGAIGAGEDTDWEKAWDIVNKRDKEIEGDPLYRYAKNRAAIMLEDAKKAAEEAKKDVVQAKKVQADLCEFKSPSYKGIRKVCLPSGKAIYQTRNKSHWFYQNGKKVEKEWVPK